jgi:hypothetical protein
MTAGFDEQGNIISMCLFLPEGYTEVAEIEGRETSQQVLQTYLNLNHSSTFSPKASATFFSLFRLTFF